MEILLWRVMCGNTTMESDVLKYYYRGDVY